MMVNKITKECPKCSRSITTNNYERHIISCTLPKEKKIRGIDFDPNWGYKAGIRQSWNKSKSQIEQFSLDVEKFFCYGGKGNKLYLINKRGHKCELCENTKWLDKPITLELDHVDGDKYNNNMENLKLLCPNCHSQTPTWRRKKTKKQFLKYSINDYINAIQDSFTINETCEKLKLAPTPSTYNTLYKIMIKQGISLKGQNVRL